MALPLSNSSSFLYDVFLSFRGTDTRHGFTGYLWKALHDKGIRAFIDDMEHERDELFKILDYIKAKGRLVLPVFYRLDPSHVRKMTGNYGRAMAMHERRLGNNNEKVKNWRKALHQAANLSGWHFKHGDGYEYEFVGRIVEKVCSEIDCAPLHVADYPVGLDSRVLEVKSLLDVGFDDRVDMVGIYGIRGIGKTTLAVAVFNSITHHFEGSCFLENVRENSKKHGLLHLQKTLLSEILGEKRIQLTSVKQGIPIIQHRLRKKKVLLLVDDVDKEEQLHAIAGRRDWFGLGSRVIITTRDKRLLACHKVERAYEVKELNQKDAFDLLKWKSFKTDEVGPSYMDILNRAITCASSIPLALEVIGSKLFGKSIQEWNSALDQYERMPSKDIQKILELSCGDTLDEEEHSHSGREIVQQQCLEEEEPDQCSRLWFCTTTDTIHVSEENKGTSKTQVIILEHPLFKEAAV